MSRKTLVVVGLLVVSTTMVYGTWLAADDMRAKPLVARVTMQDGFVRLVNTGDYAWQNLRLTINGEFACDPRARPASDAMPPGSTTAVNVAACLNAAGQRLDWPRVRARDVAVTVSRVPRFPLMNRARTASGTFALE